MLQSGLTHSLVAKFPQRSVVTCTTRILFCRGRMLQMTPWTCLCKPLMPDVRNVTQSASEQLQLSGPTFRFTMREFSMVDGYTENLEKSQNCQNWGVGAYTGMGACSGQYGTEKLRNGSTVTEKTFTWWAVTWRTLKNHGTIKIGGWALA